ncbi:hypothetical protein E2C01_086521 [Portunus trituberculatus]|uniref:Uncharacterized protein n=1 Tax=Portunus trituberculatus TaxID=210409 RepID=A0A5B7J115_PORTR|nr:hypothetical protein [Portunus trituberculatus]
MSDLLLYCSVVDARPEVRRNNRQEQVWCNTSIIKCDFRLALFLGCRDVVKGFACPSIIRVELIRSQPITAARLTCQRPLPRLSSSSVTRRREQGTHQPAVFRLCPISDRLTYMKIQTGNDAFYGGQVFMDAFACS